MFKELHYVYAVYRERSFTKAAKSLYISQPALSMMVKKAEQRIGTPIFDRSTSPLTLTEAGKFYIQQGEKILRIQDETEQYFMHIDRQEIDHTHIGGNAVYQAYVFPPIIADFQKEHPDITFTWEETDSANLVQKLLCGHIDLFPEVNDCVSSQIICDIWKQEVLLLVVPSQIAINETMKPYAFSARELFAGKHLSADAPAVDLSAFQDLDYILMQEGHDTHQRAITLCHNAGFTPKQLPHRPSQMLTAYQLASQGIGATFASDTMIVHGNLNYELCYYKIADPASIRNEYLYYKKDSKKAAAIGLFRDYIRHYWDPDIMRSPGK